MEEGELKGRIRELGEKLDAHRKERQALHPGLTLTGMYNVLEKLRAGEPLSDKDRKIHEEGLVSILKQIHDDLDAAVFKAYGWEDLWKQSPAASSNFSVSASQDFSIYQDELLTRLVALNHERAAEEANGLVRWLRPEYQSGGDLRSPLQTHLPGTEVPPQSPISNIQSSIPWPTSTAAQFAEIRKLLPATGPDANTLAACFGKKTKARVNQIEEILETLRSLGKLE